MWQILQVSVNIDLWPSLHSSQQDTESNTNVWIKSGYAFALFDGEEAAKDAISKFNGKNSNTYPLWLIEDQIIMV